MYRGLISLMPKKQPLLLDLYPNASVAYSLRKLRTAYTGNCIRVRRSSDNTEQNIGFVGNDLDSASLLSFVGGGNGFVTTLYNQLFNGFDAVQNTASKQPRIVTNGVIESENGKPTIFFDGTNDDLFISNFQTANYVEITIFATHKATKTTGNNTIFTKNDAQSNLRSFAYQIRNSNLSANFSENIDLLRIESSGISVNDFQTSALTYNGAITSNINKANFYKNGILTPKTIETNNTVTFLANRNRPFRIGSNSVEYFQGNISEIIFYENNQESNVVQIQNNIKEYYGIY